MALRSTPHHYGVVAVTLHWLSALLILVLIGSGFRAAGADDATQKAAVLRAHIPLGITILVLTLARAGWWIFADAKPSPVSMPSWQARTSRAVQVLFYVVILGMAASGIGMMILSGAGPIIFGGDVSALASFWDYRPRGPHGIGARIMLALFVLHTGAALYHQFVKKDGLMRRMWFSR